MQARGHPPPRRRGRGPRRGGRDLRAALRRRARAPRHGSRTRASRRPRCSSATSRVELLASLGDGHAGRAVPREARARDAPCRLRGRRLRAALDELARAGRRADRRRSRAQGLFGLEVAFVHPDSVHGVLSELVARWLTTIASGSSSASRAARSSSALVDRESRPTSSSGRSPPAATGRSRSTPTTAATRSRSRRVVYVKRFAREARVGFGARFLDVRVTPDTALGILRGWLRTPRDEPADREPPQRRARARRARAAGRPRRARGALPAPLRPHLQLPAHERRQPARRRGPDDADVPEDARVDRQLPLAVGAVLRLALPDRAQPRDGPLPGVAALAAGGGGARAAGRTRSAPPRRRRSSRSAARACSS